MPNRGGVIRRPHVKCQGNDPFRPLTGFSPNDSFGDQALVQLGGDRAHRGRSDSSSGSSRPRLLPRSVVEQSSDAVTSLNRHQRCWNRTTPATRGAPPAAGSEARPTACRIPAIPMQRPGVPSPGPTRALSPRRSWAPGATHGESDHAVMPAVAPPSEYQPARGHAPAAPEQRRRDRAVTACNCVSCLADARCQWRSVIVGFWVDHDLS
jgi:hypothetical protein